VPNVIILVTDGQPSDKASLLGEVRRIRNLGIKIVGVGVTSSVSLYTSVHVHERYYYY